MKITSPDNSTAAMVSAARQRMHGAPWPAWIVVVMGLLLLAPMTGGAVAQDTGEPGGASVTKVLRVRLRLFDDKGQSTGTVSASELKLPALIVARGIGGSVGIKHEGKIVFLRGIDVQTDDHYASCLPEPMVGRPSASVYAGTNTGLSGVTGCWPHR